VGAVEDGLDGVRALLPGARLEVLDVLGGSGRSRVRRVRAGSRDLIVKEYVAAGEGWVRESAALAVLPAGVRAPRLVAVGDAPPTVVMSDVGPGASVADALLGTDPAAAADAVLAWARAVAVLHRETAGARDAFRDALAARAGELPVAESTVADDLDTAAGALARHAADLGVAVPPRVPAQLRTLGARLGSGGPAALTPADTCPDNNVRTGGELALIDFESAQWRHVAWDVAYLTVPWPSCWCAWAIPDDLRDRAIDAYRAEFDPYGGQPGLRQDVDAATIGWAFVSLSWFLPRALRGEDTMGTPDLPAPSRRATILHRLDQARRATDTPGLADFADRLRQALAARWGARPLPYAPAFDRA
jgi:Phosphotransferase enzyme family